MRRNNCILRAVGEKNTIIPEHFEFGIFGIFGYMPLVVYAKIFEDLPRKYLTGVHHHILQLQVGTLVEYSKTCGVRY